MTKSSWTTEDTPVNQLLLYTGTCDLIVVRVQYCGNPDWRADETVPRGCLEVVTFEMDPKTL